nr:ceramide phosphoethanolamine synthase-like isoform X2 [Lepeophtheirus salmonis]
MPKEAKNQVLVNIYMNTNLFNAILMTIGIYIIWMDFALFVDLSRSHHLINTTTSHYSVFRPLTIKILIQGPTNHYIDGPLSHATLYFTNIAAYLSGDGISVSSVFVAGLASKCISNIGSLKIRHLGVLLYKVRDYLDALDGDVARYHCKETRACINIQHLYGEFQNTSRLPSRPLASFFLSVNRIL